MRYLLNLVYCLLAVAVSPWLLYAAIRKGKYREGWAAKLWGSTPVCRSGRTRVWLHAVSVGEVNVLRPVLKRIAARHPDWECVVSTTTKTGYELARRLFPQQTVFYCPLDFSWAVARAMRRTPPDLLVLVELELWPNLIAAAKRHGASVAIINGRLSDKSARGYARFRWFIRRVLGNVDLILAQNEEYATRFRELLSDPVGGTRVQVSGSLKFDGAATERANPATQRLAKLVGIEPGDLVFLAGSTQAPEEAFAVECFRRLSPEHPELRLILVPRHPERFDEVARILEASSCMWQRRSQLHDAGAMSEARILLVDTIGELGAWWGAAHIGFVGGSLGSRGGQNMIEPAAYGVAVSFGPNTRNFRDVVSMMLDREAAVVVRDQAELERFVARCLTDSVLRQSLGDRARELVGEQLGATDRTVAALSELLPAPAALRSRVA
ncbi:MAG: 3-deoxy-D-manno-octulosonic acid transferase [Planctomycetales bacterium]|nr:3-deoxy-D-manno-octulosonic acid transferase [Planctomycetales bacterium]